MKTTREQELNQLYADAYSESEAIDTFEYLTDKNRGKHTTIATISRAYYNHELGTLLKRFDPVAFYTTF